MSFNHTQLSQEDLPLHHFTDPPPQQRQQHLVQATPHRNWLNAALIRSDTDFLKLQTTPASATNDSDSTPVVPNSIAAPTASAANNDHPGDVVDGVNAGVGAEMMVGGVGSGNLGNGDGQSLDNTSTNNWQNARYKAEILAHPLYEQLLSAHVACLRISTPVDQLPRIEAQLAQSQNLVAKYSVLGGPQGVAGDDKELDQFMLQQHVRVDAMEAVMACWEIEQSLQTLPGVSLGEGNESTMSDDEDDDQIDSDANLFDENLDGLDCTGCGPLVLTESEKSLMERVRQELKHELKQGYKKKLVDVREEIMRKRRAGKLPGDTTSVLKAWWQAHSKWPYPTEGDKAKLVQETGLQLKQINNWFINQRKRNWQSNSSSSTISKNKRKR